MTDGDGQSLGQTWAPLAEVAAAYGVSIDTIRRRMKRGELEARRQQTPQGFKWLALMPEVIEPVALEPPHDPPGSSKVSDATTPGGQVQIVEHDREELVATLRQELALRNREIARLHEVITSQAQAITQATAALPASILAKPASTSEPVTDVQGPQETILERIRRWFAGQR